VRIESITLSNFRCFGKDPITIDLTSDLTALVGANGTGKTALLIALGRMFGVSQELRKIVRSDFHIPLGSNEKDITELVLFEEVKIGFQELEQDLQNNLSIPRLFKNMLITGPGQPPFCKIRLEARWTADGTVEGEIEQNTYWITTSGDQPTEEIKTPMNNSDRRLIQAYYISATRDPSTELKYNSKANMGRLLNAIEWTNDLVDKVKSNSTSILSMFDSEPPIITINNHLQDIWQKLNDDGFSANAHLQFSGSQFDNVLRSLSVTFKHDDNDQELDLESLSDGQRSLFSLSLIAAIFEIERKLIGKNSQNTPKDDETTGTSKEMKEKDRQSAFQLNKLNIPALYIYLIEEPENHLAPHLLGRVVEMFRSITKSGQAQVLLSSHSPILLRRVEPDEVRHFRINQSKRISVVKKLDLPDDPQDVAKYVRAALKIYPEIYFTKLVILVEGPSEEIVLPDLARSLRLELDRSFAAVVPIGGRHLKYVWKILKDLDVPFLTLLDLDMGREGGGWGRIKYVCQELHSIGVDLVDLLNIRTEEGKSISIPESDFGQLHKQKAVSFDEFSPWIHHLEKYGVYFSAPLDLDLSMLRSFREEYINTVNGGEPNIPDDSASNYDSYIKNAIEAVLGTAYKDNSAYDSLPSKDKELFAWYRYLFLNHSKPATHLLAISSIDKKTLEKNSPDVLKRLVGGIRSKLEEREIG